MGKESAMYPRLHLLAETCFRKAFTICAGFVLLLSAGCCAVPGRYCREAPPVGAGVYGSGACGPAGCGDCADGVIAERPGLLSGVFRILGIGPSCGDCGPRYWGDWGGDSAACEACDDYGNWTGGGPAYSRHLPSEFAVPAESAPGSASCPNCRQSASRHAAPDALSTAASNSKTAASRTAEVTSGRAKDADLPPSWQQRAEVPKARLAAAPRR
ncbi:MAG: hypothetical protein ACUVQQ_01405 [Thermogutta sp.]